MNVGELIRKLSHVDPSLEVGVIDAHSDSMAILMLDADLSIERVASGQMIVEFVSRSYEDVEIWHEDDDSAYHGFDWCGFGNPYALTHPPAISTVLDRRS